MIISLDGESTYPLAEKCMLEGPALVKGIPKGVTIEIFDGHPAEADSQMVCRLTSATLTPGGAWVPRGAFVVTAGPPAEIRACEPTPYVVVLQANTDSEGIKESTLRTLKRIDVQRIDVHLVSENGEAAGSNIRRLVVEVPVRSYRKLQDIASVAGFSILSGPNAPVNA